MLSKTSPRENSAGGAQTDRALVARMAQGEEDAVGDLYDRYAAPLFGLAVRVVGERADAEEVVMEAFTQAWRTARGYNEQRGSVGAWLTMMVRSRALDLGRSRQRRERMTTRGAPEETAGISLRRDDPSRSVEMSEQRRNVEEALKALPLMQRTAIELAYYDGLTHSEIATRLETPLGTVKTRIRDGMRKLRDGLHPLYAGQGS